MAQAGVTALMLKDVTGDQYQYGIVLSVKEERDGMSLSGELSRVDGRGRNRIQYASNQV